MLDLCSDLTSTILWVKRPDPWMHKYDTGAEWPVKVRGLSAEPGCKPTAGSHPPNPCLTLTHESLVTRKRLLFVPK